MNANEIGYEVDFLAVGDGEKCGDAIALRFGNLLANPPEQTVIVIDGGFKDSGAALVKHIADHYKTNHVHAAISTHPDNDHASGLEAVLTELTVDCLVMHLPRNHTTDISHLFPAIAPKGNSYHSRCGPRQPSLHRKTSAPSPADLEAAILPAKSPRKTL